MILISLEMLPLGFINNKKNLGSIQIWNDGTGTLSSGNYCYKLTKNNKVKHEGRITKFPRKRKDVFNLLWRVLEDVNK